MTIINQFLNNILAVIIDYYKQHTGKNLELNVETCTPIQIQNGIEAATTAVKYTDRKNVLEYLANNFFALRDLTNKIDPSCENTAFIKGLTEFIVSLQLLVNSTTQTTQGIMANGYGLPNEQGLSKGGTFSNTLRFSGQCIVNSLFIPFNLSYDKASPADIQKFAKDTLKKYLEDPDKLQKRLTNAESKIDVLETSLALMQTQIEMLVKGLQQSQEQIEKLQASNAELRKTQDKITTDLNAQYESVRLSGSSARASTGMFRKTDDKTRGFTINPPG